MHHAEVVDVDPERQLLLVRQKARIGSAKLLHQSSVTDAIRSRASPDR